ncbi:agmatine deiminase family protein [Sphingomonas sp. 35-24ZXX]|uniref:agmatine deiminase family protein n=1 Tax=Sphingomonas sp. 35-24ZXX TaxID=1545915 RepID=UPI00053BEC7C|nr:agmatine deiminase family protein [Sphingomonas sp. 35-24ZXX]
MTQMMPPEWSPQQWLWIGFPHLADEWQGFLAPAQSEIAAFARAVAESGQPARLVCPDEDHARLARGLTGDAVDIRVHRYGDIWLRDTGPLVVREAGSGAKAQLFGFNGWGGKYVMPGDTEIGATLADEAALPSARADWVLEGGAIDVDGTGLGVTTEQCLLNPNRNPHLSRQEIEARLHRDLGIERLLWLGDGLINDHTDGHVDNLARFVAPGTLALPVAAGHDDPNAAIYADARQRAEAFGLKVIPIPSPGLVERTDAEGEVKVQPASHMNFAITSHLVVVPVYGGASDGPAVDAIAACFPNRRTIGLRADAVLAGGGSFHCASQQMPQFD